MEENHKEIDSKTKSEVGALFQDCIVEPLTWQLQENQRNAAEAEKEQFKNIQEALKSVNTTATGIKHDTKDAAKEKTLNTVESNILGELSSKQKNITESVSTARNTIMNQVTTSFTSAGQKLDALSRQVDADEKKVLEQLAKQSEQARDTMASGFSGAEQKLDAVSQQLDGSEAKVLQQLTEQNKQVRNVITGGFVGAEQEIGALSRRVDADEAKVLEQLAVIVQQLAENAANSSTQLTQYQQDLQTEMETGKSDLTETAMQKYKVLLGVSLSFGIVNFLGVVALLIINLMS